MKLSSTLTVTAFLPLLLALLLPMSTLAGIQQQLRQAHMDTGVLRELSTDKNRVLSVPISPKTHLRPERAGEYSVFYLPFLPTPGVWPQGFVRFQNLGDIADQVYLLFTGESGEVAWTAVVDLPPGQTKGFNSDDLAGRTSKTGVTVEHNFAISGSSFMAIGEAGPDTYVTSFTRSNVGFITDMSTANVSFVPDGGTEHLTVFPIANPGSNNLIQGWLRYMNVSDFQIKLRLAAFDDRGNLSGEVTCILPAFGSINLLTVDLESGWLPRACSGAWGDGIGKWEVLTLSDHLFLGMSFMYSTELNILANVSNPVVVRGIQN